jgi:hypothetical protein
MCEIGMMKCPESESKLNPCHRTAAHDQQFFLGQLLVVKNWQISTVDCPWKINYLHTEVFKVKILKSKFGVSGKVIHCVLKVNFL